MQILCDSRSIQTALQMHGELRQLITGYVDRLSDGDGFELGNLVHFVVMHKDDTVVELEAALGFSVMTNRSNGCRYGDPDFLPSWEVIEVHHHWYEMVYVLADDGFGIVVLVDKHADVQLINMLKHYAA